MAVTRPLHAAAVPNDEEASSKLQVTSRPRIPTRRLVSHHQPHFPWQHVANLVIEVSGLPCDVTDFELRKIFERDGDIRCIDIDREEDLISKTIIAVITFNPAPEDFDINRDRGCLMRDNERSSAGRTYQIHVHIRDTQNLRLRSPVSRQQFHSEHIVCLPMPFKNVLLMKSRY
jgi:hypothetical protein